MCRVRTAGAPPMSRETSIDTAVVADFGAESDKTVDTEACASIAMQSPTEMLASERGEQRQSHAHAPSAKAPDIAIER